MTANKAVLEKVFTAERYVAVARALIFALNTLIVLAFMELPQGIRGLTYGIIIAANVYAWSVLVFKPYRRFPILMSSYYTSVIDGLVILLWIYGTGGAESPFYVLWYASLVGVAFRYTLRETIIVSLLYAAAYMGLVAVEGGLESHLVEVIIRTGYILIIGWIAGVIANAFFAETKTRFRMQELAERLDQEIEERMLAEKRARERAGELARSHAVLSALSRVTASLEVSHDPEQVMETLGEELQKIGFDCYVAMVAPELEALVIRYISIQSGLLEKAESIAGTTAVGFHLHAGNFPLFEEIVGKKRPVFASDLIDLAVATLAPIPTNVARVALEIVGIERDMGVIFLPLITDDQSMGLITIWGSELREKDIPDFSLFASQVAIAIEKARLFVEVEWLAKVDDLTGVYNRRHFFDLGEREFNRAQRYGSPLAAIVLDVDRFKKVNDTYGHAAGDLVLHAIAQVCRQGVRDVDILGRYGGEEFTVLLPETEVYGAYTMAERLRELVSETNVEINGEMISTTISLGVAEITEQVSSLRALLDQADTAMYAAKEKGRNQTVIYSAALER